MATSNLVLWAATLLSTAAWSREAASPAACQAAPAQPALAAAKLAVDQAPQDLPARFRLADAWNDAGCFKDALRVLQGVQDRYPANQELQTRLRIEKSLIGEAHFFDDLDRANGEAQLKRDTFRCSSFADLDACKAALLVRPYDPALLVANADALMRAGQPAEALKQYRLASSLAPGQVDVAAKIHEAESLSVAGQPRPEGAPDAHAGTAIAAGAAVAADAASTDGAKAPKTIRTAAGPITAHRRYSNAAPESQSH